MAARNARLPKLPEGYSLLAMTFGVGRDDYLGVVLAMHADPKYPDGSNLVTWMWNASITDVATDVAEGRYILRGSKSEDDWLDAGWRAFEERSRQFYRQAPAWLNPNRRT